MSAYNNEIAAHSSFNLPPGTYQHHIDEAAGSGNPEEQTCKTCGEKFIPDDQEEECEFCQTHTACCGVPFDEDIRICPKCGEHV